MIKNCSQCWRKLQSIQSQVIVLFSYLVKWLTYSELSYRISINLNGIELQNRRLGSCWDRVYCSREHRIFRFSNNSNILSVQLFHIIFLNEWANFYVNFPKFRFVNVQWIAQQIAIAVFWWIVSLYIVHLFLLNWARNYWCEWKKIQTLIASTK